MTLRPLTLAIAMALTSPMASAFVTESEPNDTFGSANAVDFDAQGGIFTSFQGELEFTPPDPGLSIFDFATPTLTWSGLPLNAGSYHSFDVNGVDINDVTRYAAGDPFYAITDNSASGVDTVLGTFDESGALIDTNDDSSPLGDGLADGLFGTVNANGNISLKVSGYPDFDFDGRDDFTNELHSEAGAYDLYVFTGDDAVAAQDYLDEFGGGYGGYGGYGGFGGGGDVDFVTFTNLTPGDMFMTQLYGDIQDVMYSEGNTGTGDITGEEHQGLLGLFNGSGELIAADNGQGEDPAIHMVGVVPTSGELTFGISGWFDTAFDGGEGQYAGVYDLQLWSFTLGDPDTPFIGDVVVLPDLPVIDPGDPFVFSDLIVEDGQIVNLDPVVAVGYDYEITAGDGFFASVLLPAVGMDIDFLISFIDDNGNLVEFALQAGDLFTFADHNGTGVLSFSVNGIDIDAMLDPIDTTAFITQVTFGGTGSNPLSVTQTPITFDTNPPVTGTVPNPGTLALLGIGLLGGLAGRRRRKKA